MSEPVCVCGHGKSYHFTDDGTFVGCVMGNEDEGCNCSSWRENPGC